MSKRSRQLDRDIAEALTSASAKKPAREIIKLFERLASDAESYGAENLFLARRDEGYTGDPKEFRFSTTYARRLPSYKYELLVDYIDERHRLPDDVLGRKLAEAEASWMLQQAARLRDEERATFREVP